METAFEFTYLGRKIKQVPGGWRVVSTGVVHRTRTDAKEAIARVVFPYRYTGIPIHTR
jgi:hypothetical protein